MDDPSKLGPIEQGSEKAAYHGPSFNNENTRDDKQEHSATSSLSHPKAELSSGSRSYVDLQAVTRGDPTKTTIENTDLSWGRTFSNELPIRPDRSRLPSCPDLQRVCADVESNRRASEPLSRTRSAPSVLLKSRLRNPDATFSRLPGELRNKIYELLFAARPTLMLRDNRVYNMTVASSSYIKLLPALAYVDKRTLVEVATWLLQEKIVEVCDLEDLYHLEDILDLIPDNKGWNSIRTMTFSKFSDLAVSPARARELLDCVIRCRNIEQLTLSIKLGLLQMPNYDPAYTQIAFLNGLPRIRTAEQVANDYDLDMLVGLPNLRKLTMICEWHRDGPVRCTPLTMGTFWDLQDWVESEFTKEGVTVNKSLLFNDPKQSGAWSVTFTRH